MKQIIKDVISDLVMDFLYYDRKEDEELGINDIQTAIKNGEITKDEIIEEFKYHLTSGLGK